TAPARRRTGCGGAVRWRRSGRRAADPGTGGLDRRARCVSAPLEFAATVVGGAVTTVESDGFVGYVFGLAARRDGSGGCLVVQRADDPEPHEEPYCLVWGEREGTT